MANRSDPIFLESRTLLCKSEPFSRVKISLFYLIELYWQKNKMHDTLWTLHARRILESVWINCKHEVYYLLLTLSFEIHTGF